MGLMRTDRRASAGNTQSVSLRLVNGWLASIRSEAENGGQHHNIFRTAKNIQSTGLPLPKNITHEQRYVYLSNQKGARSSTDGQLLYSLCHV